MNINVGTGDKGMTSLASGERVPKSHPRIEACGELDELASVLGALFTALPEGRSIEAAQIQAVQGELLHIGAWLATGEGSPALPLLRGPSAEALQSLERAIEAMEGGLPALQGFLLPGGHPAAAWAHVARAVCRRAERRVVEVIGSNPPEGLLPYLNRLSTYLFVLARYCNREQGIPDTTWTT